MSVITLNSENFEQEVLQSRTPVIIDFWASWCGPCRMMAPVIDEIGESMGASIKVGKVNVDENQDLAEKYEVMSIPTFVIIKDGKETARTIGIQPKEEILKLIQ